MVSPDCSDTDISEISDKHLGHFAFPQGAHLLDRTRPLGEWLSGREDQGTWPYARRLGRAAANIKRLRDGFATRGIECLGNPSNVVPVLTGDEKVARWTGQRLEENGLIANLVEFPAVARGKARFRFQVMATHTAEQVDRAVQIFDRSLAEARQMVAGPVAVAAGG